jgi:hypothetical protein
MEGWLPAENPMAVHVRVLGILFGVMAATEIAAGLLIVVLIVLGGVLLEGAGLAGSTFWAGWIGGVIGAFIVLTAIPGLFTSYGLLKRRAWSRALCIGDAALLLLAFPLGTALGAYAIYVMSRPETRAHLQEVPA